MLAQLESVLNQTRYEDRLRIKNDVMNLLATVRTLTPKIGTLINNNGEELTLLMLTGTMPIMYQNVQYNIPVEFFPPLKYPVEAPKIFIRPTANMMVHNNHEHVDRDGLVFAPYLANWNSKSNLKELTQTLCTIFSEMPPLFSRSVSPPNAILTTAQSSGRSSVYNSTKSTPPILTPQQQNSRNGSIKVQENTDFSVQDKKKLETFLTETLQDSLKMHYSDLRDELEKEYKTQNILENSKNDIEEQIKRFSNLKNAMQDGIIEIDVKNKKLAAWTALRTSEENADCEDHLNPHDDLSIQLINLQAEQTALEETIYAIEEHLRSSADDTSIQTYLKTIRKLARQLFLVKLHFRKIKLSVLNA